MTARLLFRHCRRLGIELKTDGQSIAFDAPAGVAVPVEDLRRCKPEMLAMLQGDYLGAALSLVLSVEDPNRREDLAIWFDERAGIHQYDGDMSRGEAERQAYFELARAVERTVG